MEILNIVSVVVAGLMVGTELAVAALIHPALDRLPDDAHQPVAIALARKLGKVMPPWYAAVALLTLGVAWTQWHGSHDLPAWSVASAALWVLGIVFSITALVPINSRVASWAESSPPADWKKFRRRWDTLHRWRVVILIMAYAFLVAGS